MKIPRPVGWLTVALLVIVVLFTHSREKKERLTYYEANATSIITNMLGDSVQPTDDPNVFIYIPKDPPDGLYEITYLVGEYDERHGAGFGFGIKVYNTGEEWIDLHAQNFSYDEGMLLHNEDLVRITKKDDRLHLEVVAEHPQKEAYLKKHKLK